MAKNLLMIVIAADKFKGTLTAMEVVQVVAEELRRCGVTEQIEWRPMADGGEWSQWVLLPRPRAVAPGVYADGGEAVVVSADVVGRGCFPADEPLMERSSRALGQAMLTAAALRPKRLTVAVGGTMCSDGGAGMLAALGARFYRADGADISHAICPRRLAEVAAIDFSRLCALPPLEAMIDVEARLCDGPLSAVDFAPQKALPGEDISGLADSLRNLHRLVTCRSRFDGAGGGIGFALCSVLGAKAYLGAERATASLQLDRPDITAVITGEGKVDSQTVLGGKLVDRVVKAAEAAGVPAIVVCGTAEEPLPYRLLFRSDIYPGTPAERLAAATREAVPHVLRLSAK